MHSSNNRPVSVCSSSAKGDVGSNVASEPNNDHTDQSTDNSTENPSLQRLLLQLQQPLLFISSRVSVKCSHRLNLHLPYFHLLCLHRVHPYQLNLKEHCCHIMTSFVGILLLLYSNKAAMGRETGSLQLSSLLRTSTKLVRSRDRNRSSTIDA